MELPVRAAFAGRLVRLHAEEGDVVELGALLLELEAS